MERLILSIEKQLKAQVTALQTIDEDYGQLQTEEDTYPVLFPCALIMVESIDWQTMGSQRQIGNAIVQITIAVDSYDDTHEGSGTNEKMVANNLVVRDCNKALTGFAGKIIEVDREYDEGEAKEYVDDNFTRLTRIRQSSKIIEMGIKAHVLEYAVTVYDEDAVPVRTIVPKPAVNIETEIKLDINN